MASLVLESPPSPPAETAFRGIVCRGDILEVLVEDTSGNMSFSPAVVWSVLDDGFEVYYLTRSHPDHPQETARGFDQLIFVFENHVERIPWQSVNAHYPLSAEEGDAQQKRKLAFKRIGFRDLGTSDRFYKISEEALLETVPTLRGREVEVGDVDSESDNDTEMDTDEEGEEEILTENGDLADLVVPEAEVELFTQATGTAFAEDMNRAQQQFEAWAPQNEAQCRAKDLIDSMETRIRREEANRAWAKGVAM